jgi:hypothetical protein
MAVRPDAVVLWAGTASLTLAWDAYVSGLHAPSRRGWAVSWAGEGNGGIGIAVDRPLARSSRDSLRSLPHRVVEDFGEVRTIVPLVRPEIAVVDASPVIATLTALLAMLASRPELRPRLAEADRARGVAAAFLTPLPAVWEAVGGRRTTFEVLRVMRALGYRHPIGGRPVAGDPLAARDEVVARVVADLRRNPFTRHLRIAPDRVAALVDEHYLGVEPWPFADLTADLPPSVPAAPPAKPLSPATRAGLAPPADPADLAPPAEPVPPRPSGHRPAWWRDAPPWEQPGVG